MPSIPCSQLLQALPTLLVTQQPRLRKVVRVEGGMRSSWRPPVDRAAGSQEGGIFCMELQRLAARLLRHRSPGVPGHVLAPMAWRLLSSWMRWGVPPIGIE